MNLISVYERPDCYELLHKLLAERDETANISHKDMPGWCQHIMFVESRPYKAWYFIVEDGQALGSCYLSRQNEIGIHLFRACQGRGYGPRAVKEIIRLHGPGRYLANVSPRNERSAALFANLGFKCIQHTFELNEPAPDHARL